MKKKHFIIIGIIGIFLRVILFFNTNTITRQGINYKVRAIRIPLYLKLHNFFDRHLNYCWTVDQIVNDRMTEQQNAEAIFEWTIQHILRQPPQLPIIDDHVWNIIVRGYGMADQMADVFATLSNYAGLKSFIWDCKGIEGSDPSYISLGAVYFDGAWHLCDPYRKTIFLNKKNKWASTSELVASEWKTRYIGNSIQSNGNIRYKNYFQKLNAIDFDHFYRNHRSATQSPLARFRVFLKDRKI